MSLSWAWVPRFTRAEIVFSLKSFAAAMLALYVASRAGLPRPFWAMLTSYVVAAPLAGSVRSKALYRFLGTLIGCTATVLLVPALADAPELSALALALWVGGCLFLSLQDRSARSYVFMLAGYTAALIGFPSIETPPALFDNAVARVEEIGLGILSATLVHSLVFPVGLGPALLGLLDRCVADARGWLVDLVQPAGPGGNFMQRVVARDRQRLASDITQLRLLSHHVPFDTGRLRWTAGAIGAMQDGLAGLTPALSAVEDRLQALAQAEGALAPDVVAVLDEVAQWLASDGAATRDAGLASVSASLNNFGSTPAGGTEDALWRRALRIALAQRLDELVHRWRACEQLRGRIDEGLVGAPSSGPSPAIIGNRVLHKDRGLALLSAFAAVLAICLCCAVWIATAWPSGSGAAMMAAVFCSFFATLDDPVPAINGFLKFTLVSIPVSALYVLVLLPVVHDFGMLALVCAPTFLLLGGWAGRASTFPAAMATLFGVAGTLSMHDTAAVVDLPAYANSILAQVLGIGAAALVTRLVRTVGAEWSARRIRRATWVELGALASAAPGRVDDGAFAVRMVDRIGLLAARVAQASDQVRDEAAESALRDLRAGTDLVALQRAREPGNGGDLERLFSALARLFRERAAGQVDGAPPSLLAQLDAALVDALATPGATARSPIAALVGLRRNLFPQAAASIRGARG